MKKLVRKLICALTIVGLLGCAVNGKVTMPITGVMTPENVATASVVLKGLQVVYNTICAISAQKVDPIVLEVLVKTDKSLAALGQIVVNHQIPAGMSVAQAIVMGMEALVEITAIIAQ